MRLSIRVSNYRCFSDATPAEFVLEPGVTAFVGANNAGKTTVFRLFWELRNIFEQIASGQVPSLAVGRAQAFNTPTVDVGQLFCDSSDGPLVLDLGIEDRRIASSGPSVDHVRLTVPRGENSFTTEIFVEGSPIESIHSWSDRYPLNQAGERLADTDSVLEAAHLLSRIRILGQRRNTSVQMAGREFDEIAGSSLISTWNAMKAGSMKAARQQAAALEERLKESFGPGDVRVSVSSSGNDLIVSLGGQTYEITEIGSGFSHFLVALLTFSAAAPVSWAFIDEPENGLHPTKQIDLIRLLQGLATEGVVLATHNYGLARRTADVTYLVARDEPLARSTIELALPSRSLSERLGELGFAAYLDLGFDRLLLVEGPGDADVVDELGRTLALQSNVVVLPIGGSNAMGDNAAPLLAEISRLCPRVYALIDSELASDTATLGEERVAFVEACKANGIVCHVLERRAIDNYMPERVVHLALGPNTSELGAYGVASRRFKSRLRKMARSLTPTEVEGTDLVAFLRDVHANP